MFEKALWNQSLKHPRKPLQTDSKDFLADKISFGDLIFIQMLCCTKWFQLLSLDEILKCDYSNESY